MPALAWDPTAFNQAFPEFASANPAVNSPAYTQFWVEAGFLCDNSGSGPISDATQLRLCLNLLVAHLASIQFGAGGVGGGTGIVGRVSEAQEGTVRVSATMGSAEPGTDAWYNQTPYGARYLMAIGRFRTFRYYAPCRR